MKAAQNLAHSPLKVIRFPRVLPRITQIDLETERILTQRFEEAQQLLEIKRKQIALMLERGYPIEEGRRRVRIASLSVEVEA